MSEKIPESVIKRLPKYYRYLCDQEKNGVTRVSSQKMSTDMDLNASQIRRDLNCFGGFGQQGYGYEVKKLKEELAAIMGIGVHKNAVIIGAGNIGQALIKYADFKKDGFDIIGIFDIDENIDGCNCEILSLDQLDSFVAKNKVTLGIISVPKTAAQETANRLVAAGVTGIWNFCPIDVAVPKRICIENVHLSDSLYVLSYRMTSR